MGYKISCRCERCKTRLAQLFHVRLSKDEKKQSSEKRFRHATLAITKYCAMTYTKSLQANNLRLQVAGSKDWTTKSRGRVFRLLFQVIQMRWRIVAQYLELKRLREEHCMFEYLLP